MKTTMELPDRLLIAAKQRAAAERRPLRALVEEGLRHVLRGKTAARPAKLKWVVAAGGAPDEIRSREAMYDWLERHA